MTTGEPTEGSTFGRYRIGRLIGSGGFGSVFLAQDLNPHLPREVALKVLREPVGADTSFRQRFLQESMLAVALDHHPNIVPIYDAGEADGRLFIAMRYIKGTDLRSTIDSRGPLPVEQCVSIIGQVAAALDTAHAAGLVHRDVKPGNILLSPDLRTAYLADFGVAKSLAVDSGLTTAGDFLGTVAYAAPEQLERHAVDGRTDEYSLACVLYECLCGKVPFEGDIASIVAAHLTRPLPDICTVRPELPPVFDRVIARATEKAPSRRYPNCGEFALAVEGASRTGSAPSPRDGDSTVHRPLGAPSFEKPLPPTPAPPPPVVPPAPPDKRRRWPLLVGLGAAAAGVVAVLLLVVAGGGGSASYPDEREQLVLDAVPSSIRESCARAPDDEVQEKDGDVPAVVCTPDVGADSVTFIQFPTRLGLDRAYGRRVSAQGISMDTEDDCSEKDRTEGPYTTDDNTAGRVLCYRATGRSFIVWTAAEFHLLATAERGDRNDSKLYEWWAELVDAEVPEVPEPPGPDGFPNALEDGLLANVPRSFRDTCVRDVLIVGSTATIVCSPPSGVDTVYYNKFPDLDTLNAYYENLVDNVGVVRDSGAVGECPREIGYEVEDVQAGRYVCWLVDGAVLIAWSADEFLIGSQARRDDGNVAELLTWWRDESGPY